MTTTAPIALITGGSRGLGLLIATELGERGFHVVLSARNSAELDAAAQQLTEQGIRADTRVCDVSDNDAVEQLVRAVETELGPIDTVLAVAGVIQVGALDALQRSHFEEAINTMLWGPINVVLAVLPAMRERDRGRIGIVSSVGGMVSVPHLLPYSTAKFGAFGFSQGLRSELSGQGVSVTSIVPGLMRTGSHLHAKFTGDQGAEYAWFSAGASLPLISMDARVAARRIVEGTLAGRGMVLLTPMAKIGVRVHGLAPSATAGLLGLVGRLLPAASGPTETIDGAAARDKLSPRARRISRALTTLGDRAARRTNELSQ